MACSTAPFVQIPANEPLDGNYDEATADNCLHLRGDLIDENGGARTRSLSLMVLAWTLN